MRFVHRMSICRREMQLESEIKLLEMIKVANRIPRDSQLIKRETRLCEEAENKLDNERWELFHYFTCNLYIYIYIFSYILS